MSKYIRIPEEKQLEYVREFQEALKAARMPEGKLVFSKDLAPEKEEKAKIYYTADAWTKQIMLLAAFDKEVAWHGVVKRMEGEENAYLVYDILVYPQTVTSSTVDMDVTDYAKWLTAGLMAEDERYDHIFMQAHSHVNMAVSPSGKDLEHQSDILARVREDGFYIFMIWNKRFESNNRIYDFRKNVYFENKDIEVCMYGANESMQEFLKGAKDLVKNYTYVAPTYQKPVTPVQPSAFSAPAQTPAKPQTPAAPAQAPAQTQSKVTPIEERPKVTYGAGWLGRDSLGYYNN